MTDARRLHLLVPVVLDHAGVYRAIGPLLPLDRRAEAEDYIRDVNGRDPGRARVWTIAVVDDGEHSGDVDAVELRVMPATTTASDGTPESPPSRSSAGE
jgi:hypothetical protein